MRAQSPVYFLAINEENRTEQGGLVARSLLVRRLGHECERAARQLEVTRSRLKRDESNNGQCGKTGDQRVKLLILVVVIIYELPFFGESGLSR